MRFRDPKLRELSTIGLCWLAAGPRRAAPDLYRTNGRFAPRARLAWVMW
jgi:hypothetical protein